MKPLHYILNPAAHVTVIMPDGRARTVAKGNVNWSAILNAIKASKWEQVVKLMDIANAIKQAMNNKVEILGNHVYFNGEPIHNLVAERITESMVNGMPCDHLIKFLGRLLKNPDKRCVESLYKFMEQQNIPIDEHGNIVAYKSLRPDFKDWHTGTILHKVGTTVKWGKHNGEQPLTDVDYGQDCSGKGYHAGSYNYAFNFNNVEGRKLCLVRIDPAKVISVPSEGSMGKIRVSEYLVVTLYNAEGEIKAKTVNVKQMRKVQKRDALGHFASGWTRKKV